MLKNAYKKYIFFEIFFKNYTTIFFEKTTDQKLIFRSKFLMFQTIFSTSEKTLNKYYRAYQNDFFFC